MARPGRNNVDYFPHDVIHGSKMFVIEQRYGNDGYAVWFKLLEQLGKADYHYLDLKDKVKKMYLASIFKVDEDIMMKIITDLAELGAIDKFLFEEYEIIFSEKFIETIQDAYKRRNNECITLSGLCEHLQLKCKQKPAKKEVNSFSNDQSKVNKSKVKDSKLDLVVSTLLPFYKDSDFQEVWVDFEKVREKKKAAKSERSYKTLAKKLLELSGGRKETAIKIVTKSADSGWADLYALDDKPKQEQSAKRTTNR